MRFVFFCHSLISDWNHGNAHFLRGVANELLARDHDVCVFEPADGWSLRNLRAQHGEAPIKAFHARYPRLQSHFYSPESLDLNKALDRADVAIVHEWNPPALVRRIGAHRAANPGYRLLFHDTHHRSVSDPQAMTRYDLSNYDGVLAFGDVIREIYLDRGWAARAWTWHEAADTRVFQPVPAPEHLADLVWIGNWGDGERKRELREFLLEPAAALGLDAAAYGVRYPVPARRALHRAGIQYGGWLANYRAPEIFARFKATVHIPRRFYREHLPGIPTIRVFEALACGIPLVCAPWEDAEHLFTPGEDYLVARDGDAMIRCLRRLMNDRELRAELAARGYETIRQRHTCAQRVDELLAICDELQPTRAAAATRRLAS